MNRLSTTRFYRIGDRMPSCGQSIRVTTSLTTLHREVSLLLSTLLIHLNSIITSGYQLWYYRTNIRVVKSPIKDCQGNLFIWDGLFNPSDRCMQRQFAKFPVLIGMLVWMQPSKIYALHAYPEFSPSFKKKRCKTYRWTILCHSIEGSSWFRNKDHFWSFP